MQAVPCSRYVAFFGIAAAGCAADLSTKSWIFHRLGMPDPERLQRIWVFEPWFSLTVSLNEGALFGFGRGWTFGFAALSIAAAVGILYWLFVAGAARDWFLTTALGAITAGIFGNLYDRLGLPELVWTQQLSPKRAGQPVYAVRDWLHFKIEGIIDWPVFNLADSLLVCGAALLFWHALRGEKARHAAEIDSPVAPS